MVVIRWYRNKDGSQEGMRKGIGTREWLLNNESTKGEAEWKECSDQILKHLLRRGGWERNGGRGQGTDSRGGVV